MPRGITPKIVPARHLDSLTVDEAALAAATHQLEIPDQTLKCLTMYIDARSYFITNRSTWPKGWGRWRFWHLPDLHRARGIIVRIGVVKRGQPRSAADLNRTLIHELEHVAQIARHDKRLLIGYSLMCGCAVVCTLVIAAIGYIWQINILVKILMLIIAFGVGWQAGYKLAPHERQARFRARQLQTSTFKVRHSFK